MSLLYGINYSIVKIVVPEYIGAYGLIVYRVFISAIFFWLIFLFRIEKIDWKRDGWRLVLCSLTGAAVNMLLFYKGMGITTAVNGSIIMTLTPVIVLIWAALLLKERISRNKILGIFIGLVGAIIIFYSPEFDLSQGHWLGDLLILGNATSYACYLVIVKPLMRRYKPITVVTWIFTFGAIFVLPVGFDEASSVDFNNLTNEAWWSAGYAIIMVTVVVYLLNAWMLSKVDSSVVGAFIYLQPVFATLTAILFFNEVFLIEHLIAASFVFVGVWLVTKKSNSTS